jgi:hypothetical protein
MSLRDRLRRIERESREEMTEIPQPDGSVARFPLSAAEEAFLHNIARMKMVPGEAGEPHPLCAAASNSSDPRWRESAMSVIEPGGPVEDLSEP